MNSPYSLILATDLDGTFLGGSEEQRTEFYQYLAKHRDRLLLIFVTGRHLESIQSLYSIPEFPQPDYIIGDVGTTILNAQTLESVSAVQDWVASAWGESNERVQTMLANDPGIELQPIEPKYRVSYFYEPDKLQPETVQKITDGGFDCILSADKYLDVMPKGVSKGPTLLKLISHLNLNPDSVIAAGDTFNDFTLFQTGLKSIAVGNSEPKLAEAIKTMDNVYYSSYPGAAGIWDGLKTYGKNL